MLSNSDIVDRLRAMADDTDKKPRDRRYVLEEAIEVILDLRAKLISKVRDWKIEEKRACCGKQERFECGAARVFRDPEEYR